MIISVPAARARHPLAVARGAQALTVRPLRGRGSPHSKNKHPIRRIIYDISGRVILKKYLPYGVMEIYLKKPYCVCYA